MNHQRVKKEWISFGDKIVYLYEKLFNEDKELLISYFSDQNLKYKQKNRKKTIENWLKGETKKPNGFYLSRFRINEYKLHGELLLPEVAFRKWEFTTFKKRVDQFLLEKENFDTPNQLKYIYFFSTTEKKLSYFKISYPDPQNETIISLNSPTYTDNITYHGSLTMHSSMCYINVMNEFDQMSYIFKNNVNFYKNAVKVFGVAQAVDALSREPKAFLTLLTSNKLTQVEEDNLAHKLNYSNLLVADDFSDKCVLKGDYFLENFLQKIQDLNRDTQHYAINEAFKDDMYFDILLQEYQSYIKLLEHSLYHSDYPINQKRQSLLFALENMCQEKRKEATILYHLDRESINILDRENSIMNTQLSLVKSGKLTLSYLFIVEDIALLTERVVEQLYYLEAHNIAIKLTQSSTFHSKILIVEDKNFAIYKRKNEENDNQVTRNRSTIENLKYEVEEVKKDAVTIEQFIQENYPLNGTWYHYSFSSKKGKQSYHENVFQINNYAFKAFYPDGEREGLLLQQKEYTLILLENSVIRLHNIHLKERMFPVSIIGKEIGIYHKDILLFGLFSKDKLSSQQALHLLNKIHQKETATSCLKISNDFDTTLAYFDVNERLKA